MHKFYSILFSFAAFLCLCATDTAHAAIGQWRAYLSYYDITNIVRAGSDDVFVLASNDLYSYNLDDMSITTYDRTNVLSDSYISTIGWNTKVGKLLIAYSNSNIDLMDIDGNVTNISELYNKSFTEDKTINSIYMYGKYAYLATGFGVMKIDMDKAEISESYIIYSYNISQVAISGNTIYAKRSTGEVLSASLSDNLIDRNNWTVTTDYDSTIFDEDTSDYDDLYDTIASLNPGGPKINLHYFLRVRGNKLYSVPGGYYLTLDNFVDGEVQVLNDLSTFSNDWTIYEDDFGTSSHLYIDVLSVDADPFDDSRVFASGRTGLYEFHDGELYENYTYDKYPFTAYLNLLNYQCIHDIMFDDEGNLWLLNSIGDGVSLFSIDAEGTWHDHHHSEFMEDEDTPYSFLTSLYEDSRGLIWFLHNHWDVGALMFYNPSTDEAYKFDNFVNQDNTSISFTSLTSIAEDNDGNIWVGSNVGPFYLDADYITTPSDSYTFTQFKVPRNDGTNYADYLLSGVSITDMCFDAAGRKWFATQNDGVYLISEDNLTEEQHFTFDNSYLLDNGVYDVEINDETGEVFFATSKGLCSYMGDATTAYDEMVKDNVYAYPNPVEPGYTGLITVVGLSYNADVKIVSANGTLIAEGRSSGGSFTWDGNDKNGERVASGVYMVLTAKSDGSKGTVCKIAIVN